MKHSTKIHVRFADIDAMGHVNNAVFLNYFEQARIDFFNTMIGSEWDWKTQGIVLARNEIDYLRPIFLNNKVLIETQVDSIGEKSMTLSFDVYDEESTDKRKTFAKGKCVIVAFDYETGTTTEIPENWRHMFTSN